MDQEQYQMLVDLHRSNERQGPGGSAETLLAARLAGLSKDNALKVADIGCGTGAASLLLAEQFQVEVTAVDSSTDFLHDLTRRAEDRGVSKNISTLSADMENLPFEQESFDVLWAEGSIYNMGFKHGVIEWRQFLKPGGILAVSEITWLTPNRPKELEQYWNAAYKEISVASSKITHLEESGYTIIGYFVLPPHCWQANYYEPLAAGFSDFLTRHTSDAAQQMVSAEREEIALYEKYQRYFSYGFYIASKA